MKKKRLNRDAWGFQGFPYYQMRIDCEDFHGFASFIKILSGEYQYWEMPKTGRVAVCGEGMTWLQFIPDNTQRLITVKYFDKDAVDPMRVNYPEWAKEAMCPSVWYVDVMENLDYAEDGMAVYVDKYLDVIFSPEGDVAVDDRPELDEAYQKGDLTKKQYEDALTEGEAILKELCEDVPATAMWCAKIRREVERKIEEGLEPWSPS